MVEPLLLLPGAMCDARLFWHALVRLSAHRSVQIGSLCAGATVEEMAQATLADAPARFALLGLGLGGIVALEVIRRAPQRVHRIALISTDPLAETPQASAARELRIAGARAGRLEEVLAEEVPGPTLAPGPGRGEVLRLLRDMGRAHGAQVYIRQSRAIQRRPDQQKTLRKILHPTLVLCGAHDVVVPPRRQSFMAELMPRARFEQIENAGHMPPLERPAAVSDALERWFVSPSALA